MAIRNLLVAYDGSDGARAALSLGLKMARKYGAHLTGLMPHGTPPAHLWHRMSHHRDFMRAFMETDARLADEAEASFHAQAADQPNVHWLRLESPGDRAIIQQARYFDLTLMGQFDPDREDTNYAMHPDRVALQSGRPLIVVPRGHERALGDHAVLAWDGQRAAARALSDAMQILETKTKVTVLHVKDKGAEIDEGALQEHLERHGIPIEWCTLERQGGTVAQALLRGCRDATPELLIMGAYEHSKFREDLFGGMTNDVLRHMPSPILMAH